MLCNAAIYCCIYQQLSTSTGCPMLPALEAEALSMFDAAHMKFLMGSAPGYLVPEQLSRPLGHPYAALLSAAAAGQAPHKQHRL
jgi:hypothetical protein